MLREKLDFSYYNSRGENGYRSKVVSDFLKLELR